MNNTSRKGVEVAAPGSLNLVGNGTVMNGDIVTSGDIRIDGKLKGTLRSNAKIVLGEQSVIEGDVFCQNADISGHVSGNIRVEDTLVLKVTARIQGDIITGKLVVESGAEFTGTCKMENNAKAKNFTERIPLERKERPVLQEA